MWCIIYTIFNIENVTNLFLEQWPLIASYFASSWLVLLILWNRVNHNENIEKNQSIRIMAFYPQPFANQVFLNFWELKVGSQLNWFLHYRDKIQKDTKAQIYKKTELKSNEIWQYMYTLPESESSLLNFIVVKRKKNIWFVNFQCTHAQKMAICQPHYAFLKP